MLSTIPFAGFYQTQYDESLDQALESMFSDECGDPVPELVSKAFDRINWQKVHLAYAQMYCDQFLGESGIKARYESMESPKEYNFTTDRIFVEIEQDEAERLFAEVDKTLLQSIAASRFTSYDGFISYYEPDFHAWGDVAEWDHNQLGCLLTAYAENELDVSSEFALVEDANCNGWLDDMLCESCDLSDLFAELDKVREGV